MSCRSRRNVGCLALGSSAFGLIDSDFDKYSLALRLASYEFRNFFAEGLLNKAGRVRLSRCEIGWDNMSFQSVKRIKLSNSGLFSLSELAAVAALNPRVAFNVLRERFGSEHRAKYPYQFILMLTDRCNFACPMCAVGEARAERLDENKKDMAFEVVEKIIDEARQNGAIVQLFGGEPTLYGRLEDLLKLTKRNRVPCFITTNGLLLERKAEILVGGGLQVLHVSLDGWDDVSQKLRGNVPGSFDAIYRGLTCIRKLRGNAMFPIFRISTVITKENYHSLDRIGECVQELGVKEWVISNYFFITPAAVAAHESFCRKTGVSRRLAQHEIGKDSYFDPAEVDALKDSLEKVRARCDRAGIRVSYPWQTDLDAYYSPRMPSSASHCCFIGNRIEIYSDGRIGICGDGLTIGNVMTDTVRKAWNSKPMLDFLGHLKRHGSILPMCFRCCGIVQSDIRF